MIRFETFESLEFDLVLMHIYIFFFLARLDYIQFELLTYLMNTIQVVQVIKLHKTHYKTNNCKSIYSEFMFLQPTSIEEVMLMLLIFLKIPVLFVVIF